MGVNGAAGGGLGYSNSGGDPGVPVAEGFDPDLGTWGKRELAERHQRSGTDRRQRQPQDGATPTGAGFLWQNGKTRELVGPGDNGACASEINERGQIVGAANTRSHGGVHRMRLSGRTAR